jgi:hypothetical protein
VVFEPLYVGRQQTVVIIKKCHPRTFHKFQALIAGTIGMTMLLDLNKIHLGRWINRGFDAIENHNRFPILISLSLQRS